MRLTAPTDDLDGPIAESKSRDILDEADAVNRLADALATIRTDLQWYWHWGDGEGGAVLQMLADIVRGEGYNWPLDQKAPRSPAKQKISRVLAKQVFERNAYRCVKCESYIDLCCDHIIPESRGGLTALENLQTMCRSCNAKKGVMLPEDMIA